MDYSKLTSQLFKVLRGERSLEQLARISAINKSTVFKWEHGNSRPSWSHFISLLELNQKDKITKVGHMFAGIDYRDPAKLTNHFSEIKNFEELIYNSGVTRQTINSILSEKSDPKVEVIFKMWHLSSPHTFTSFLDQIVGLGSLEETSHIGRKWDFEYEVSKTHPFIAGIINILERPLSKEETLNCIQQSFDLAKEEVEDLVKKLLEVGICEEEGDVLRLAEKHLFDSNRFYSIFRHVNKYWIQRAIDSFSENEEAYRNSNSRYSYLVMNLSENALQQVQQEYIKFYSKIRDIQNEDSKDLKTTHALTLQLVDIEEPVST